jgi:hypothetical protein
MNKFCEHNLKTRQVKAWTRVMEGSRNCRWEADSTLPYRWAEEVRV